MKLRPEETELIGKWFSVGSAVGEDPTAVRIELLTRDVLQRLGSDSSGWDVLYRDPDDGRLWELTFPGSDSEGGGPPRLAVIETGVARRKYGVLVD
jgi:hypothetical protein